MLADICCINPEKLVGDGSGYAAVDQDGRDHKPIELEENTREVEPLVIPSFEMRSSRRLEFPIFAV
jgi:hypothetical protein